VRDAQGRLLPTPNEEHQARVDAELARVNADQARQNAESEAADLRAQIERLRNGGQ